jgi:hypothetical protein
VTCPDCGDAELTVEDMTVWICLDDQQGSYTFTCPSCNLTVHKEAEPRIVNILIAHGVRRTPWSRHPDVGERPTGPAFTFGDLLDFADLLADDDWFVALEAMVDD